MPHLGTSGLLIRQKQKRKAKIRTKLFSRKQPIKIRTNGSNKWYGGPFCNCLIAIGSAEQGTRPLGKFTAVLCGSSDVWQLRPPWSPNLCWVFCVCETRLVRSNVSLGLWYGGKFSGAQGRETSFSVTCCLWQCSYNFQEPEDVMKYLFITLARTCSGLLGSFDWSQLANWLTICGALKVLTVVRADLVWRAQPGCQRDDHIHGSCSSLMGQGISPMWTFWRVRWTYWLTASTSGPKVEL